MSFIEKVFWTTLCALYVLNPLDLDFIPFFGWIDDAFVIWLTYRKLTGTPQVKPSAITVDHVG
jgi:uncharacterized membrane protein YkvA (DUF1232 family)